MVFVLLVVVLLGRFVGWLVCGFVGVVAWVVVCIRLLMLVSSLCRFQFGFNQHEHIQSDHTADLQASKKVF